MCKIPIENLEFSWKESLITFLIINLDNFLILFNRSYENLLEMISLLGDHLFLAWSIFVAFSTLAHISLLFQSPFKYVHVCPCPWPTMHKLCLWHLFIIGAPYCNWNLSKMNSWGYASGRYVTPRRGWEPKPNKIIVESWWYFPVLHKMSKFWAIG